MLSRRMILAMSFVAASAVEAGFFVVAPNVNLFQESMIWRGFTNRFQVRLHGDMPPEEAGGLAGTGLVSRPGSVQDLLSRHDEFLRPPEPMLERPAPVPELSKRLAAERLERDYDLERDGETLKRLDAKILEITQAEARRGIEVARRLVRPSPDRIVGENEFAVLRSVLTEEKAPLRLEGTPRSLLAEGVAVVNAGSSEKAPENPPPEREVSRPELIAPPPAPPPIEQMVARAPVKREAAAARQESPYAFMDDLVDIQLESYAPPEEEQGYFRLRILPKENAQIEVLPKRVTFVVDASKSIIPHKLKLTIRGLERALGALRPEDHFNIVVFRDSPSAFRPEPVAATKENKADAADFLARFESKGETDIYKALLPVVRDAPREGLPGVIVVITDGHATTGLRDSRGIINGLTRDNDSRNTIYAFGGGRTVNRYLLDLLAYRNKGESYVAPKVEDIDEELPRFLERLQDPLLVGLRADYGQIPEENVFPRSIPDFYRGQAVTVYGRFDAKTTQDFVMRLSGAAQDKQKEVVFRARLADAATGGQDIARNWAFQKAYYIIGQISRDGETPELLAQLRELGAKYGVHTSYDE